MKKFIGIDFGDIRIGVSKCDPLGILATGVETINRNVNPDYIKRILEICDYESCYNIVLGKPLRLNGNSEIQVQKVENFAEELKKADNRIKIIFEDERYTTKEAEYYLKNYSKKNAKQKRDVVDMIAATIILQTYINKLR